MPDAEGSFFWTGRVVFKFNFHSFRAQKRDAFKARCERPA
jgi:hypothetical protein